MRISFPNREQGDILAGAGEIRIGAAADNHLIVADAGVAPHHLRLKLSARGIELAVLDAQARTHVNMRPVRERAILRLGDIVSLGSVQFVLKPDRDADIRTHIPPASVASPFADPARFCPPRALLRGLSGMYFGKIVPVRDKLIVGSGGGTDIRLDEAGIAAHHAAVEWAGGAIVLRGLDVGVTSVDGVEVRDALLQAGDQLCFGRDRFLVEAPGLPSRPLFAAAQAESSPNTASAPAAAPSGETASAAHAGNSMAGVWWLIAVAALIACAMVLAFLFF